MAAKSRQTGSDPEYDVKYKYYTNNFIISTNTNNKYSILAIFGYL